MSRSVWTSIMSSWVDRGTSSATKVPFGGGVSVNVVYVTPFCGHPDPKALTDLCHVRATVDDRWSSMCFVGRGAAPRTGTEVYEHNGGVAPDPSGIEPIAVLIPDDRLTFVLHRRLGTSVSGWAISPTWCLVSECGLRPPLDGWSRLKLFGRRSFESLRSTMNEPSLMRFQSQGTTVR